MQLYFILATDRHFAREVMCNQGNIACHSMNSSISQVIGYMVALNKVRTGPNQR